MRLGRLQPIRNRIGPGSGGRGFFIPSVQPVSLWGTLREVPWTPHGEDGILKQDYEKKKDFFFLQR